MLEATPATAKAPWIVRELRIGMLVPGLCAWFFSTLFRDPLGTTLVYAYCIGFLIQLLIEGGRYAMAWQLRQRRPDDAAALRNWPGWHLMVPWVVVAVPAGYFPGQALGDWMLGVVRPDGWAGDHQRALMLVLVVALASALGVVYFLYARARIADTDARAQLAMRSAAEYQLKLLESQLEPHMLFNTLANLRVLIGLDPARAQAMLDHLIAFLRATLVATRSDAQTAQAEFARLADYLALMQIRMGTRMRSQLDLDPALADLLVPPLLLQPLVENAIKHGLEPKLEGGRIAVSARRESDQLVLTVRDTGAGLTAHADSGERFGMRQVSERLATLYGGAASVTLSPADDAEGGALAVVRLPIGVAAASPAERGEQ